MMMPACFHRFFLLAGAFLLVGCGGASKEADFKGKLVPVSGVVKIDGAPVAGVQIAFVPRSGIGGNPNEALVRIASGTTDSEGKYTLSTHPGGPATKKELEGYSGILPGKYSATFSLWVMPDGTPWEASSNQKQGPAVSGAVEKLPAKLGNPSTTPHSVEIKEGGNTSLNFDLTTK